MQINPVLSGRGPWEGRGLSDGAGEGTGMDLEGLGGWQALFASSCIYLLCLLISIPPVLSLRLCARHLLLREQLSKRGRNESRSERRERGSRNGDGRHQGRV